VVCSTVASGGGAYSLGAELAILARCRHQRLVFPRCGLLRHCCVWQRDARGGAEAGADALARAGQQAAACVHPQVEVAAVGVGLTRLRHGLTRLPHGLTRQCTQVCPATPITTFAAPWGRHASLSVTRSGHSGQRGGTHVENTPLHLF
jgi:hypothetical protein